MKMVRIPAYKVGLVFDRKGEYRKCLAAGKYWIGLFNKVLIYNVTQPFYAPVELNILLQDQELADKLTVVEVKDNEIALQYVNGNFKAVLEAGRYAFWKGVMNYDFKVIDFNTLEVDNTLDKAILQRPEVARYMKIFFVETFENAMLMVDGEKVKSLETGTYRFWNNTKEVTVLKADMRKRQMEISGQELLTKDKAALRINFDAQFKVNDVEKALLENKDYEKQIYVQMQLALRAFVGTLTLDELLANKEAVGKYVLAEVAEKAQTLGVKVLSAGVKDIILPGDMKDIMNQVLIAQKQAQANSVMRREETAATRNLLNTAKLMEDNKMLLKLKEMEYVERIAEKIGEITVSGKSQIVDQLSEIFVSK